MIAVPHPNVLIARQAKATLPVEVILRRYMAKSSTMTSVFDHYTRLEEREIYGITFPDNLSANEAFPENLGTRGIILTPTTKAEQGQHDAPLTDDEARKIVDGQLGGGMWNRATKAALALFERAQAHCLEKGLILVDTKLEFGIDEQGELMLIDEVFTPDSSRFWLASSYAEKFAAGETPETFDKELLRRWLAEEKKFKGDGPVPKVDGAIIKQMAVAYAAPYEMITGDQLPPPISDPMEVARALSVMKPFLKSGTEAETPAEVLKPSQLVVIIMGSESDKGHADKIGETLTKFGVPFHIRVGSAHKSPEHVLQMLKEYEEKTDGQDTQPKKQIIYIAVAGRSNALGGFISGNSRYPVINAPPPGESHTIFSSLEMPSGIAATTVLYPEAAGLAAVEIFALSNPELATQYIAYQEEMRRKNITADEKFRTPSQ